MALAYKDLGKDATTAPTFFARHSQIPREDNEKLIRMMFETFNVPAFYVQAKPVLTMYATGRTTGLPVVFGHNSVSWAPIFEGHLVNHCLGTSRIAGKSISNRLLEVLQESHQWISNDDLESIHTLKAQHCYVAQNYEIETQLQSAEERKFNMPNGTQIALKNERFRAPEVIFKPNLIGMDVDGLQFGIADAVLNSPMDMRSSLKNNIILAGEGARKLPGFTARLSMELKEIDIEIFESCTLISPPEEHLAWIGGSIVTSLSSFEACWIAKAEYEEEGEKILHRRCLE